MGSHTTRRAVNTRSLTLAGLGLALLASACDDLPGRDSGGHPTHTDDPAGGGDSGANSPITDAGDAQNSRDGGAPGSGMDAGPHDAGTSEPPYEFDAGPPPKPDYVRVEAEDFLPGPDGYYDTTTENQGGYGRLDEGVDVGISGDLEGGSYSVGYTRPGEWMRYAFTLEKGALYTFRARVAHETGGGQFSVFDDDELLTRLEVPGSGGWTTWVWVERALGALSAGEHTLKITMDTTGLNGADTGNFNFFDFVPVEGDGGLPIVDAGLGVDAGSTGESETVRVESEAFLAGPDGYNDTTPQNEGGFGSLGEGVDVGFAGDPETPGSLSIGYTKPGEWLLYTLELARTAEYTLRARVAHESGGGDFSLYVDGALVCTFTVPSTGSWGTWTTIENALGTLQAGSHTLKLTVDTGGANGSDAGNVNYLEFVPAPPVDTGDAGLPADAGVSPADAGALPGDAGISHAPDSGAPELSDAG
jgi:hypothetical protein